MELSRGVEVELEEKGGAFGVLRSEQLEMALTFGTSSFLDLSSEIGGDLEADEVRRWSCRSLRDGEESVC